MYTYGFGQIEKLGVWYNLRSGRITSLINQSDQLGYTIRKHVIKKLHLDYPENMHHIKT